MVPTKELLILTKIGVYIRKSSKKVINTRYTNTHTNICVRVNKLSATLTFSNYTPAVFLLQIGDVM